MICYSFTTASSNYITNQPRWKAEPCELDFHDFRTRGGEPEQLIPLFFLPVSYCFICSSPRVACALWCFALDLLLFGVPFPYCVLNAFSNMKRGCKGETSMFYLAATSHHYMRRFNSGKMRLRWVSPWPTTLGITVIIENRQSQETNRSEIVFPCKKWYPEIMLLLRFESSPLPETQIFAVIRVSLRILV